MVWLVMESKSLYILISENSSNYHKVNPEREHDRRSPTQTVSVRLRDVAVNIEICRGSWKSQS